MTTHGDVEIDVKDSEALETAIASKDTNEICVTYTNIGLSHYARKRYDCAINCFEKQVAFITQQNPNVEYDDQELEALCFAYRLLSQLYDEIGQNQQAILYYRKCKEVEIDACLQGCLQGLDTSDTNQETDPYETGF